MEQPGGRLIALICAGLLAGCGAEQASAPPPGSGLEPSALTVDSLRLEVVESFPVQVIAVVEGTFPDTCSEIDGIDVGEMDADGVMLVTLSAARPADQVCAQAVTPFQQRFELPVQGLSAGTYTLNVNGLTESFELEADNTIPANGLDDLPGGAALADCPPGTDATQLFVSDDGGFCFLFPVGYEVLEPSEMPNTVVVQGPASEDEAGAESVAPSLVLSIWAEGVDQAVDAYVADLIAEAAETFDLERTQTTVDGLPAEVVSGLPGRTGSRQAWVGVEGTMYHLLLQPVDPTYPESSQEADRLWEIVLPTLTFFPREATGGAAPTWQTVDLPEFGVRVAVPGDWEIFRGAGFAALGEPGGNPNLITIAVVDDLPVAIDALTETMLTRYENQGEPNAEPGPTRIGGVDAVRFTGLATLCVDVLVPDPAAGVVRQISVHADACQDGAPSDTVINILDSLELIGG